MYGLARSYFPWQRDVLYAWWSVLASEKVGFSELSRKGNRCLQQKND